MKPKGRHPELALTAVKVRGVTRPGRYADGNGLYLAVDPSGAKRWVLRIVVRGRRRDIGLGSQRLVSLAEAREQAVALRKSAREGGDPVAERRKARASVPTFAEAAHLVHGEHAATWKNAKHSAQWINTLTAYVFPYFGDHRVDHIETPDVLRALSPIWLTKPETARRVRQRIATVIDWAKAAGFRSGDNPVDGVSKGLPRQPDRSGHHAALPYSEVAEFVSRLRSSELGESTRLAFEFLILTATRTSEVLGAKWPEFDTDERIWSIPPIRTKAGRPHRVPLAPRCCEILLRAKALQANSDCVFPGQSAGKPMSNMIFLMALRRMALPVTAHGFRSSFRDWAAESTNFPREVCELALAHRVGDKTEAAYQRGDLLEKRRKLMGAWAAYVTSEGAKVVQLRDTERANRPGGLA